MTDIEPLRPDVWLRRIEMLARGELGSIESTLRHAGHLHLLAPTHIRKIVRFSLDESAFERLLEVGAFRDAAQQLARNLGDVTVTASRPGQFSAVVDCQSLLRPFAGKGGSEAAAIIDAWASCLKALATEV